jgi:HAD superfamily hydrolase (TIGR01450 family)
MTFSQERDRASQASPAVDVNGLAEGYIFDLDGTIYLGNELLPGALHTVETLRAQGRKVLFLSNNPTREIGEYVRKLNGLGLSVTPAEILTTVETVTRWLLQHHPESTVFPIAEEPVRRALAAAGIRISDDPEQIDIVIASYDRGFAYHKLQIAFDAIAVHKRAFLIATNPDRFCPFPGGRGEPDAAAIIGAIEGCTGVRCRQVVGKPDVFMLEAALQRLNLPASACVMVGDRLSTDIQMAVDAEMPSALVLTGETTPEILAVSMTRPTHVLKRIDELLPATLREHTA